MFEQDTNSHNAEIQSKCYYIHKLMTFKHTNRKRYLKT